MGAGEPPRSRDGRLVRDEPGGRATVLSRSVYEVIVLIAIVVLPLSGLSWSLAAVNDRASEQQTTETVQLSTVTPNTDAQPGRVLIIRPDGTRQTVTSHELATSAMPPRTAIAEVGDDGTVFAVAVDGRTIDVGPTIRNYVIAAILAACFLAVGLLIVLRRVLRLVRGRRHSPADTDLLDVFSDRPEQPSTIEAWTSSRSRNAGD